VTLMDIDVHFYSYFKDLTGCAGTRVQLPEAGTMAMLLDQLYQQYPALAAMRQSTLIAVGVEYQDRSYRLKNGDQVSLFPPVQGG
jgi:molybdopterin converting factor small subunit